MSNRRGRNEEEDDDLETEDNNKRPRNNHLDKHHSLPLFLANKDKEQLNDKDKEKEKEKEKEDEEEDTDDDDNKDMIDDDDNKDMIDDYGEDMHNVDDDYDEQLEDGSFPTKYFYSECLPPPDDESDLDNQDDDDDDCGYISDYSLNDRPLKQDDKDKYQNVHVDPHSGFIGDLVDEHPFKEDGDQEEHDAFERRIEARRSPKMCSGQKEVDIDEEEEEEENRDSDEDDTDNDKEENVETDPDIGIVMEKDDRVWALPDILVTVHKPGKDSSIGVVQQVLPDGSFKIALGSSGNGEVIIAVKNEIEIVEPRVSDKVKIMATSHWKSYRH